jgi:hypothetical protein
MNGDSFDVKEEWRKARRFFSDKMDDFENKQSIQTPSAPTQPGTTSVTYSEVVAELLSQIGKGCDIIPISSSFDYEDLMRWVKDNAVGNQVIIVKDSLANTTGQILSVAFAKDNVVFLNEDKPKVCFVYKSLNPTIADLFPSGKKVYIKPIKF